MARAPGIGEPPLITQGGTQSSRSVQSPLGAGILPVEHTIRRWRVGTAQHASETSCGRTTGCYDAIPIRGRENKVRAGLGDGAVPRVQNGLTRRHVKFKLPIG